MEQNEFQTMVRPLVFAHKDYSKIFGIGYNKTGTTTLQRVFRLYGFDVPAQQEQEIRIVKQLYQGNHRPFVEFVSKYDAFQDKPFSQEHWFITADCHFPDSRFILTIREPEIWYESMYNFVKKIYHFEHRSELDEAFFKDKLLYLYENYTYEGLKRDLTVEDQGTLHVDWDLVFEKDFCIAQYERRNKDVLRYFQDRPKDLLVIDVSQERTTRKILEFLNIPEKFAIRMPHENKA